MNQRVQSILDFAVKVFIVTFALLLMSYALLMPAYRVFDEAGKVMNRVNSLSERFEIAMGEPVSHIKMRIYGMSMNPETLYKIALLKEEQGDLAGAVEEMSSAVGLVAPDVERYQNKLKELKVLLSASK